MSRIHAFEWEDLPWFPPLLRQYLQDFLRTVAELTPLPAAPVVAEVRALVERHGSRQLVDLCSGGGGVSVVLAEALRQRHGLEVTMTLSDLFPHLDAMERLTQHRPWLRGHPVPVDATQVPAELAGMRIITNAFHHFDDELARQILLDAQRQGQPFVATELVSRSPTGVATLLIAVAALMVVTPLIRPVRLSRLLLTYVVPAVPFFSLWDGLVSCLRVRTPAELRALCATLPADPSYQWRAKTARIPWTPGYVTLLVGEPVAVVGGLQP